MRSFPILAIAAFLTACSGEPTSQSSEDLQAMDARESPSGAAPQRPSAPTAGAEAPEQARPPISLPRIAYTYGYTFRLSSDTVAPVQERHLELCRQLGPARCRIVNLERSAPSGDYLTASTRMQVAAPIARAFGDRLVAAAAEAGGEAVARSISGEDLSRQMIDAEARIRTREALIRRLTTLLETRSGNIQQAVEAERAINTAQEELDAARGWLAEMRTRVDMSTFDISYASGAPLGGGIGDPLRHALGDVGSLFARSLAAMILLVGVALPWALVGLAIFYTVRRVRRRRDREEPRGEAEPPVS